VKLKSISDVNNFVSICSKYYDENIDVKQGRQTVNGKSILGIYSLNLLEPLDVLIYTKNRNVAEDYYNKIRKWEINISYGTPASLG